MLSTAIDTDRHLGPPWPFPVPEEQFGPAGLTLVGQQELCVGVRGDRGARAVLPAVA